jgi:hypothetical protein
MCWWKWTPGWLTWRSLRGRACCRCRSRNFTSWYPMEWGPWRSWAWAAAPCRGTFIGLSRYSNSTRTWNTCAGRSRTCSGRCSTRGSPLWTFSTGSARRPRWSPGWSAACWWTLTAFTFRALKSLGSTGRQSPKSTPTLPTWSPPQSRPTPQNTTTCS